MAKVLLLELNEINFDLVEAYVRNGKLPVLGRLIADHGLRQTSSECRHEFLEPWIQWVTAHTGLDYSEHGVFRLGDIVDHEISQIWEQLEAQGLRVGAVSPMNAKNRTKSAAFFVPDPWTRTNVTGSRFMRRLHRAVCTAVNVNAESRLAPGTAAVLVAGVAAYARPRNCASYGRLLLGGLRKRWMRALLLDVLLGDIFIRLTRRTRPDFASLFLNAGAHIQHHYLFNSPAYRGTARNPAWYVHPSHDPVLDAYQTYDRLIGQVLGALAEYRLMVATGLQQDPHNETTFYWRLRDHMAFLRKIGIRPREVEPRMSRDFILRFDADSDASCAESILRAARASDGTVLFEIDNRGRSLFVMVTYPHEIEDGFKFTIGDRQFDGFRRDVVFVAIKNGEHNGSGSFIDTGMRADEGARGFELKELPARIRAATAC